MKQAVKNTFFSVSFKTVFTTQNITEKMPYQYILKPTLSTSLHASAVRAHGKMRYRWLEDRINEHVSAVIRKKRKINIEKNFATTEEGIESMIKHYNVKTS